MKVREILKTYHTLLAVVIALLLISLSSVQTACAQNYEGTDIPRAMQRRMRIQQEKDSTKLQTQSPIKISKEDLHTEERVALSDTLIANDEETLVMEIDRGADSTLAATTTVAPVKKQFIPEPAKATWYAAIFPGGGQIYNRKYWKLPIIYGGFVGCAYALTWNGQMYEDYSQAYLDIMDDNPETDSFENLLPPGYNVEANLEYLKKTIKRKKDFYRRYRDLSIFCFIGVYIVSIIDAYVDAELASFDITDDLSLKMEPTCIPNNQYNLKQGNAYGLQCSIKF